MLKPPTGEPCAGEPHARFGGRGGRRPFPTPICRSGPCPRHGTPDFDGALAGELKDIVARRSSW
jgi:hypothetical protein